ncbi:mitochondrial substrate carrier family protein, partial [Fagus crenata]
TKTDFLELGFEGFDRMSKEDEDDPKKKRAVRSSSSSSSLASSSSASSYRSYDWLTNFHRDLMAGAVMGRVVHTIMAPIERAKLLLQTQESNLAIVSGGGPHSP